MIRTARTLRIENSADSLAARFSYTRSSVDLFAMARHRRVKELGLRFIVPRGVLLPTQGGFQVYLRDMARRDIDISEAEPDGLLSPHQRFSLAHEIAHTFFYKFSEEIPAPDDSLANPLELEKTCDRTAGYILVPSKLLKRAIHQEVGDKEKIDATFVRRTASEFRASLHVLIERLAAVEPSNPFERCLLLARRIGANAEIRAAYFGIGLLPLLPRPRKYTKLTEWLPDFPLLKIESPVDSQWQIIRMNRAITFVKIGLGAGQDFLLQVQADASRRATVGSNLRWKPSGVMQLD